MRVDNIQQFNTLADRVFAVAAGVTGVSRRDIESASRVREVVYARTIVAQELSRLGFTQKQIGAALGCKPCTVSVQLRRYRTDSTPYFVTCAAEVSAQLILADD